MKGFPPSLLVRIAALSTIVVATPAYAQTPAAPAASPAASTCQIEQGKPQSIARATLSLTRAQSEMKSGDPMKDLKDIVTQLTAPGYKNENPVGRAFLLASAYVFMLDRPGIVAVMPRSAVGITTDPTAPIDLFAAADSAITIVEQSSPGCETYMAPFREQKAWLNVTNGAINALNANQLDSAEVFARRSLTLDRKSPYAYSVLASIAKTRKNYPMMLEYSKQALVAAGTDSSYADIRDRTNYDIAATMTLRAQEATGAEKKAMAREAINGWLPLLTTKDDVQGTQAVQNIAKMYIAAGDSLQLGKIYAPMIVDPQNYAEGTLLQAGVLASQFKRPDDAALLFNGVASRNPYQRDALNNLAASYIQAGENDKVVPVIDKLVALDPSNPDNWLLYAFNYVGLMKHTKDPKLTRMYNDSLVYYNTKSEKMPVKVQFTEFTRNNDGTVLAGSIENRSTTAKTYALSVEFLGPKGEVVYSETANVGPVAPKGTKTFTIKTPKTGVAGYRYKPLT
jgi:tetratricopeptide (TPR) repeat protein